MQIGSTLRQLERMTTHTPITCTTWWQQMMEGRTCRGNLSKEFLILTINQIIYRNSTIYVTKSLEALAKGIDSIFNSTLRKPPQAGRAYRIRKTIMEYVTTDSWHLEWPLTQISRSRYHSTSNNTTNSKSYMIYRVVPLRSRSYYRSCVRRTVCAADARSVCDS